MRKKYFSTIYLRLELCMHQLTKHNTAEIKIYLAHLQSLQTVLTLNYGTKWFLVMVRNCNFVVRNGKLWSEMVMVRNGYGTK
jgi:hypothetical protein